MILKGLNAGFPGDDDNVIVTIDNARTKCSKNTFILPLDHIFCSEAIHTCVDT